VITQKQALEVFEFHAGTCRRKIGPKGGVTLEIRTWRKNGAVKTWKTRPEDFEVPIKFGLYGFGVIFFCKHGGQIKSGNAHLFHAAEECPLNVVAEEKTLAPENKDEDAYPLSRGD
jgi:hypothetical protein